MKKIVWAALFSFACGVCMAETYVIDVRTPEEFATGHVDGALNIVHAMILDGVAQNGIKPDDYIKLYCRSGKRASVALDMLKSAGYTKVENLGGYEQAKAALGK